MRSFWNKALLCVLAFFILSIDAAGQSPASPSVLWNGERLVFRISWFGIPAGTAVVEAKDAEDFQGKKTGQPRNVAFKNAAIERYKITVA